MLRGWNKLGMISALWR